MKATYQFLSLKEANAPMMAEIEEAANRVIRSGWYINGENVKEFENEFAQYNQVKYAIAVSNGYDALKLILRAYIELGCMAPGDEVIVPTNTYIASALAVSDNGLVPVFAEPDAETMNLDIAKIEQYVSDKTKAIMPVHLYGTPCWNKALKEMAENRNLKIIEDNAQAIGAQAAVAGINGTTITGSLGHASGISFYPTKNLGALGDAGAVTANDEELANAVRNLANYGADYRYHNIYCGHNCRMDEMQAAILRVKLKYIDDENVRRAGIAKIYDNEIHNPWVIKPQIFKHCKQVWYQYVLRVKNREAFRKYMYEKGIETDVLYPTPLHKQPCYSHNKDSRLPFSELLANEIVSLPISINIGQDDAKYISNIINQYNV